MNERDIWASANLLIEKHGDEAAAVAARRADHLFDRGDLEGAAIWRRIISAIEAIRKTEPDGSVH